MRRVEGEKLLLTYRHACLVREFGGTEYRRVPKSSRSRLSLARQKTLCFSLTLARGRRPERATRR